MVPIRIVAIPTEIAEKVRQTMRASFHRFPAHAELATDDAPCRHCLRTFAVGKDRRILFTYDRFAGVEDLPQPGPVYIHEDSCPRYECDSGFPEELRHSPRTLEAYGQGRRLLGQEYVKDGKFEAAVERLFRQREVDYIQVHSTTAGCFTFRIERADRPIPTAVGHKDQGYRDCKPQWLGVGSGEPHSYRTPNLDTVSLDPVSDVPKKNRRRSLT